MVIGYNFLYNIVFLSPKIDFDLASSASTDEKPRYAAFNLAPHCLPKYLFWVNGLQIN